MALYEIGSTIYATKTVETSACGDHPLFHHASRGDKLYVIKYKKGAEHPYCVSKDPQGTHAFWVSSNELMSQKPFNH